MNIPNLTPVGPPDGLEPRKPFASPPIVGPEGERSFSRILQESIDKVNELQKDADLSVVKYSRGEATTDEVAVAFQKAKLAFDALTEIRNKLLDAFEELQRMRI